MGRGPPYGHPRVHRLAQGREVQDLPEPEEGLDPPELLQVGGGVVLGLKGDPLRVQAHGRERVRLQKLLVGPPVKEAGELLPHQGVPVHIGVGKPLREATQIAVQGLLVEGRDLAGKKPGHKPMLLPKARGNSLLPHPTEER